MNPEQEAVAGTGASQRVRAEMWRLVDAQPDECEADPHEERDKEARLDEDQQELPPKAQLATERPVPTT